MFASLVCAAGEILIDVFKATVDRATNPAVRRLMELILRDEVRHIAFGWHVEVPDSPVTVSTPKMGKHVRCAAEAHRANVSLTLVLPTEHYPARSRQVPPDAADVSRGGSPGG